MITDTITVPELVWTLMGVVAIPFHCYCAAFFFSQLIRVVQVDRRRDPVIIAITNLIVQLLSIIIQTGFTVAGAYQMTIPPANVAMPITPGAVLTTYAIVQGEVLLVAKAAIQFLTVRSFKRLT